MSGIHNPNQMIVEGVDDKHSVIGLMKSHVDWPEKPPHLWPVHLHVGNGAEEILSDGVLTTFLKGSVVKKFGVMLDADSKPRGRYGTVRNICKELFPHLPTDLPPEGAVVANDDGQRLGVWIMPDNAADGALETFLKYLVPDSCKPVWDFAVKATAEAKALGAPFTDTHRAKAEFYTWLAWQDPSSQTPGLALTSKMLNPHCPTALAFVDWFQRLYELPAKDTLFPL